MTTYRGLIRAGLRGIRCFGIAAGFTTGSIAFVPVASAQVYNPITNCYDSTSGLASFCPQGNPNAAPKVGYDPCFLQQNAMRPCTKEQGQASKPVGVDPNLIGTWELPLQGGPWVLEILRNGSYRFHSDAADKGRRHAGAFAANNGHWWLKATTGHTDGGNYVFQKPDTWIATGRLGTAASRWARPSQHHASE